MTAAAEIDVSDLCFAARALAQTHPMTEESLRYRQACFEQERERQPVTELADWASTALLVGYCLRRSEEQRAHSETPRAAVAPDGGIDLESVTELSESLRLGDPGSVSLLPAEVIIAALDQIIGTELDKRREHLREQLDDAAWSELEDYIAWWVIHGYALRASERPRPSTSARVLVVGVGNVLHGDDGFGVEVVKRLRERRPLPGVTVAETGIGGIHLVHELMAGYDALLVVDAVDRDRAPGTVMVIDAEVIDVAGLDVEERHDLIADMHLATPERALMVAKAAGVLPERTVIVGCQPAAVDMLGIGLTAAVNAAVDHAVAEVERCVQEFASTHDSGT